MAGRDCLLYVSDDRAAPCDTGHGTEKIRPVFSGILLLLVAAEPIGR